MSPTARPTLKDVAALAGVSRTTASNALDGSGRVSSATRTKVQDAAERLGYSANVTAARLRSKGPTSVGLYIPQSLTDVAFHMRFTLGAASGARQLGVDLTLLAFDGPTPLNRVPAVDGLMIVEALKEDSVVERLLGFGMPTLLAGKHLGSTRRGSVIAIDHEAMMTRVLDYLESIGAERPGLLGPQEGFHSDWSVAILRAYREWCSRRGIPPAHHPAPAIPNAVAVDRGVRDLITHHRIDSLIGAHEGSAALAVTALQRLGITVGPRFPVVSGVGSDSDEHTLPPLTAVDMHPFEFGVAAAQRLIGLIQEPSDKDQRWAHDASLTIRESTETPLRLQTVRKA